MAGGDYGNIHGNKAKTKSGRKHRNERLTVVLFVPFVGDDDGRKGVVIGEVDLRHVWQGRQENPLFRAQGGACDARSHSETRLERCGTHGWKESKDEGVWMTNFAVEREVLGLAIADCNLPLQALEGTLASLIRWCEQRLDDHGNVKEARWSWRRCGLRRRQGWLGGGGRRGVACVRVVHGTGQWARELHA
jgi:hypothetical protein